MTAYRDIISAIQQHLNETLYLPNAITERELQDYIDEQALINGYNQVNEFTINFVYELQFLNLIADKYAYDLDTDFTFVLSIDPNKLIEPVKASTTSKEIYHTKYSASKQPIHNEEDLYRNLRKDFILASGSWKELLESDNYHGVFGFDIYDDAFIEKLEQESVTRLHHHKIHIMAVRQGIDIKANMKQVTFCIKCQI